MTKPSKLNDLQMILLSTAAARADGNVFPVSDAIKDKAAEIPKAIASLLDRALLIERPETVLARVSREDNDQRIGLAITDAGYALIDGAAGEPDSAPQLETASASAGAIVAPKPGSKTAAVLALLGHADGATLADPIAATGWLPHTTRAALTGLRKKGHRIERAKRGDTTCYHLIAEA